MGTARPILESQTAKARRDPLDSPDEARAHRADEILHDKIDTNHDKPQKAPIIAGKNNP